MQQVLPRCRFRPNLNSSAKMQGSVRLVFGAIVLVCTLFFGLDPARDGLSTDVLAVLNSEP